MEELILRLESKSDHNLSSEELEEVEELILKLEKEISACTGIKSSLAYFNLLERIQFLLAKHHFKYNGALSDNLRKFVSEFDRIDDEQMRTYLFDKIKKANI